MLVSGQAGIGKSALVRHVVSHLERLEPAPAVGTGWAAEGEGAPPLWVWLQAVAALGSPGLGDAMAEGFGTDPADADAVAAARFQRLATLTRMLVAAAGERPAVLVLEDLHWADAASLALLDQVAAVAGRAPLLVVGTSRDEEALHRLTRYATLTAVRLPPLTPADVARLLRSAGASDLEPSGVHERTGGLPLLVEAVARRATLEPTVDLRSVAEWLLRQVPSPAGAILREAALLDDQDPALLAEACGVTAGQVLEAFDAGRRAGLLALEPPGPAYRFHHALLREGLRATVPLTRAREVNQRSARALGRRAEADERVAAAAAAQWARVGTDLEALAETARWSTVAGRRAARSLSPEDAARHLARAVEALRRLGSRDAEVAEALVALAEAQYLAGDYPRALETCGEASSVAESAGRDDLVAAAALVVRWVTYPEAVDVVSRLAVRALERPGVPEVTQARLLAQLATMNADAGRAGAAGGQAVRALEMAERHGDPLAMVDAARARELTLVGAHDGEERLRLGDLVVRHGVALGQPVAVVLGHEWRLRAGYELARLSVVEDAVRAIALVAERTALPLVRWHHLRVTAAVAALEGRFAAARSASADAHEIAVTTGDDTAAGLTSAFAHRLAQVRGDPGETLPGTREHLERMPPQPILVVALAQLNVERGRRQEGRAWYERLVPLLTDAPTADMRWPSVALDMVELAAVFDDARAAAALLPHLEPFGDCPGVVGVPTVYFTGSPRRELGNLLALLGRIDDAVAQLRAALAADTGLGARPYVVACRLDLSAALLRRGTDAARREAAAQARAAATEARRLDLPGPLARADALLREITAAERTASPLSEREAEVAELMLRALSNRQIAARLVISERTVESHVSSILRKEGVATRTEYLARRGAD